MEKEQIAPFTKMRAQKILTRIESGNFDENDIYNIFMTLREYSSDIDNPIFREVGDFVAHNDERNKGMITESLEILYLKYKFFFDYLSQSKAVNISKPFPLYVKRLILDQIDKYDATDFNKKFSMNKNLLKSQINTIFSEDKKNEQAYMKKHKINDNTLDAINDLLKFKVNEPIFNQDQLISDFLKVIKTNNLKVDTTKILEHSDKMTVCIMLLLHQTKFNFKFQEFAPAYCMIARDNLSISHNRKLTDKESLGNLNITVMVQVEDQGKHIPVAFPIITTHVSVSNWCETDVFVAEKMHVNEPLCSTKNGKIRNITS